MAVIHPLAFVDPRAELGEDVEIGPFCVVEADTVLGARTRLEPHATVKTGTHLGEDNFVGQGSVLGGDPQDRKFAGEKSYLRIGDRNIFREYVTIHRATGEGEATRIGNDCFIMAYSHMGHNVTVEDKVTMANNAALAGHSTVETLVTIGGMSGVHQFARIGKVAMVGGMSRIVRDVPPFTLVAGFDQRILDINAVGLRRVGITPASRLALHKAIKLLFKSELGLSGAIDTVKREVPQTEEVKYLLEFELRRFRGKSGRGDQQ